MSKFEQMAESSIECITFALHRSRWMCWNIDAFFQIREGVVQFCHEIYHYRLWLCRFIATIQDKWWKSELVLRRFHKLLWRKFNYCYALLPTIPWTLRHPSYHMNIMSTDSPIQIKHTDIVRHCTYYLSSVPIPIRRIHIHRFDYTSFLRVVTGFRLYFVCILDRSIPTRCSRCTHRQIVVAWPQSINWFCRSSNHSERTNY